MDAFVFHPPTTDVIGFSCFALRLMTHSFSLLRDASLLKDPAEVIGGSEITCGKWLVVPYLRSQLYTLFSVSS